VPADLGEKQALDGSRDGFLEGRWLISSLVGSIGRAVWAASPGVTAATTATSTAGAGAAFGASPANGQ